MAELCCGHRRSGFSSLVYLLCDVETSGVLLTHSGMPVRHGHSHTCRQDQGSEGTTVGIPRSYNNQTDILPYRVSQTVTRFGYTTFWGNWSHDERQGYLLVHNLCRHKNFCGSTRATYVCTPRVREFFLIFNLNFPCCN